MKIPLVNEPEFLVDEKGVLDKIIIIKRVNKKTNIYCA
jgi:hypothetical protein